MTNIEIEKLQSYFNKTFKSSHIIIKPMNVKDGSAEVYVDNEFFGTIYKDVDDGETTYNFTAAILDLDL